MNNNEIKIVALGGVEEIGINCTAFEIQDEIIVIDSGMGFPEDDQYGVDYLIPNIDYLLKNKKKIKGVFITHSHLDHIGALHLLLPKLGFPKLYAPRFATELIKIKLKEHDLQHKVEIETYKENSKFRTKNTTIEFFRVNHSAPDSFGIAIKTSLGYVVHSGDFKFDNSPVGEEPANYGKIAKIGHQGVLALLSDSTNSFKKGHSTSESEITEILKDVVEKADGRIIVATFSQLVLRINQLLIAAENLGRKVAISGRSLEKTVQIARKLNYIQAPDSIFVPLNRINRYPKKKQMILTTGHQGETMAALSRIARGEHRDVKIKKGDTVILSSSIIPGNDLVVQKMIDDLSQRGAKVYHQKIMDLHAGGHGYQEDQKLMINLVKPKYFIPIHGYQSFLTEHGRTAEALGINKHNVIITQKGKEIVLNKKNWKFGATHRSKPVLVSGHGVGDIGDVILSERSQLANNGIVVVNIYRDQKKNLAKKPEVLSKGFYFFKNYTSMQENLISEVSNAYNQNKNLIEKSIKDSVYKALRKYIHKELDRDPIIVVNIF